MKKKCLGFDINMYKDLGGQGEDPEQYLYRTFVTLGCIMDHSGAKNGHIYALNWEQCLSMHE